MIINEPAVPDTRLLGFCTLATCRTSSTKFLLDFIVGPRPHSFDSVTLSCARKKGTAGVENDSIFAESFLSTKKSNKRKKRSARRVLLQVNN